MKKKHLNLSDGSVWPCPLDIDEWKLRHSEEKLSRNERLIVASIMNAYSQLIFMDNKTRNKKCKMIREKLNKKEGKF